MAFQKYRGNVLAANFPLLSTFGGHTVILPQIDQFYIGSNTGETRLLGIPQVMFMENVMPTANGLSSVGFSQVVPLNFVIPAGPADFDQAFWLRDKFEDRTLFVPAHGRNYTFNVVSNAWVQQQIVVPREAVVSVANIKERTFVCYSKYITFLEWNGTQFIAAELRGLAPARVNGLVSANAYLIAYTDDTIYWSSILDPTDFLPSLATTSGSSGVLSLKGKIVYCTPIADGFLIWTTYNVVSATYSGNSRFPFTFKEIAGSPGITDPEQITNDNNATLQYANTGAGVVRMDRNSAQVIYPELNEFLNCRRFEFFDYAKKEIVQRNVLAKLMSKLYYIANRYIVFSYGVSSLTHALVFDNVLNRWGKLRVDHVDCFEFIGYADTSDGVVGLTYDDLVGSYDEQTRTYEEFGGIIVPGVIGSDQEPYKSLGFLQADGKVFIVNFDLSAKTDEAVLIFGKFQFVRSRFIDLHELWLEEISETAAVDVLVSLNGNSFAKTVKMFKDLSASNGRQSKFLSDISAHSYAIQIIGDFDLTTTEHVFSPSSYN